MAGVSLPRALEITSGTVGNGNYQASLLEIEERVKKGEKFSSAIRNFGHLYPPTAIQMIAVGEDTGELDYVLEELAEFYEGEIDQTMNNLPAIIEPILILTLGLGVGAMAVAIIMPMYSLTTAI